MGGSTLRVLEHVKNGLGFRLPKKRKSEEGVVVGVHKVAHFIVTSQQGIISPFNCCRVDVGFYGGFSEACVQKLCVVLCARLISRAVHDCG